jgi:hypothetical protein
MVGGSPSYVVGYMIAGDTNSHLVYFHLEAFYLRSEGEEESAQACRVFGGRYTGKIVVISAASTAVRHLATCKRPPPA